ncbi:M48 family metallopeptidase [Bacillus sp. DTU_2020_1000418_1_SI_GHA_SEK_038]|uniref:M48 family metallopeptidase n=1 Tax=Bacillus sp. DTU_2020_1000418_1_SI_GHA_SEK_038 TaxID=3077585 RepID=UPI0028E86DB5|nr:M48 family metallopeptidase [Bacillus sp. DTU_2020_1000418_1_SI_GHA_SEK_038]WNS74655.1 M48 family metallopeptidase [Bacillus sp. DTU_2020_1000418_1_SI_GHA_SEK_038]
MQEQALRDQLVYPKENIYFAFVALFSILAYIFLAFSIVGILFILILILLSVVLHGIMIGGIRRNGVKISENQFPELYEKAVMTAKDMGLTVMPDIYVIESEGVLNAFATRFFRKNMVVLYSGIFELIERSAEKEVLFVLAHEFAHLKRKHVIISFLLLPAMWVPFLGNAYLRACEYTCDRYAAFYIQSLDAAKDALTMLAIGKELYSKVNKQAYMEQLQTEHGFFVWLNEKLSTHPHLPKRIYALSRFFSQDSTDELKEPKGKVWVGIVGAGVAVIILSACIFVGMKAIEKMDFWSEMASGIEGATPLMNAASENDTDTIQSLVADGVEIDAQDSEGSTALHWAVYNGSLEAAEMLLEHGADPNIIDTYESSALINAVYNDDVAMAELLLRNGADPSYQDSEGYTAYDYAVDFDSEDLIKLLKQ